MHRFIAALLAVASYASIAQAQSADPISTSPSLTLDQALSLAGATAPSLQAATAGVRAAEAGRTVAGYRPNPSIVAGGGEMNRVTSSLVSDSKSDAASEISSSRSVALPACNTGR